MKTSKLRSKYQLLILSYLAAWFFFLTLIGVVAAFGLADYLGIEADKSVLGQSNDHLFVAGLLAGFLILIPCTFFVAYFLFRVVLVSLLGWDTGLFASVFCRFRFPSDWYGQ